MYPRLGDEEIGDPDPPTGADKKSPNKNLLAVVKRQGEGTLERKVLDNSHSTPVKNHRKYCGLTPTPPVSVNGEWVA